MLARTKSAVSGVSSHRVKHTPINKWHDIQNELMHEMVTHKKPNHGIKLLSIYKQGNNYSFTRTEGMKLVDRTLIVNNIEGNENIPRGSLIVGINNTNLSEDYYSNGYRKFLNEFRKLDDGDEFVVKYRIINPHVTVPYELEFPGLKEELKQTKNILTRIPASTNIQRNHSEESDTQQKGLLSYRRNLEGCENDEYCTSNLLGDRCDMRTGYCVFDFDSLPDLSDFFETEGDDEDDEEDLECGPFGCITSAFRSLRNRTRREGGNRKQVGDNKIKTKRNRTKRNKTKRNKTKRNKTKRNKTLRRNKTKRKYKY